MKMIKLTQIDEGTGVKSQAFFNPETFGRMHRDTENRCTEIWMAGGGYDMVYVTQTPAKILSLIADLDRPADPFAGLDQIVVDGDAGALDQMLAAVELIPGEAVKLPDTSAVAKVIDSSWNPSGERRLTVSGSATDFGHVHVGDIIRISTLSERAEKVVRMALAKEERARLVDAGILPADTSADPAVISWHHNAERQDAARLVANAIRNSAGIRTELSRLGLHPNPLAAALEKGAAPPAADNADNKILAELHEGLVEGDGEIFIDNADVARLIELGWVVAVNEGIVLDAEEYRSAEFNKDSWMVFLGVTKTGFSMLDAHQGSPETIEEDALEAFERSILGDDPNRGEAA